MMEIPRRVAVMHDLHFHRLDHLLKNVSLCCSDARIVEYTHQRNERIKSLTQPLRPQPLSSTLYPACKKEKNHRSNPQDLLKIPQHPKMCEWKKTQYACTDRGRTMDTSGMHSPTRCAGAIREKITPDKCPTRSSRTESVTAGPCDRCIAAPREQRGAR